MAKKNDTTADKQAHQAKVLEAVWQFAAEGIVLLNANGCILDINPAGMMLFGLEIKEQLIGKRPEDIVEFFLPDGSAAGSPFKAKAGKGEIIIRQRVTGRKLNASHRGTASIEGDGVEQAYVSVFEDITDKVQLNGQLHQSQEIFRNVAENARVIICIVQGEKYVYVNPYLEEASGYSKQELMSMHIGDIVHADFREMVVERARKRQAGDDVESNYEMKIIAKDGKIHWIDFSASRISYFGKPAIIAVAFDVTERKRIEDQLKEIAERLQITTEAGGIGAWQWDINGHVVLTQEARHIFGIDPAVSTSFESITNMIHPDDRDRVMEVRKKAIQEHSAYDIEYRVVWPDQSIHWLHSRGRAYYDHNNKPVRMYGVISDASLRKKAEQELRESEQKFRLLAENANAVIGIIQGKNFVYVNPYLEEISGYSRDELIKIDLAIMLHPDYRQMVLERAMKRQMGMEVQSKYQFIMITKSGTQRWMDFCAARIMYMGRPAIVGIALDITESKQNEEQLVRLKTDLENKNNELEAIIGVVSHDLRSPIVNIRGFADELKKDCSVIKNVLGEETFSSEAKSRVNSILEENVPESINFIDTSTKAMSRLIDSLMQVAKAGTAVINPERINMDALLKEVLASFEFKIKEKNIDLTVDPLPDCIADRTQATGIFSNLVDNAIKYLDPARAGWIRISGKTKADQVIYCVEDNGIGIEGKDQERIFEMFFRLKTRLAAGEGLGLAMVKRIAERNGGKVCLESEPGKGSRFYVSLPGIKD